MPMRAHRARGDCAPDCSDKGMEISPVLQGQLLVYCALLGALSGVLAELAQVLCESFRCTAPFEKILQFVLDLLLVLFSGVQILLLCYYFNKGEVRAFAFLGFFAAFAALRAVLGKYIKWLFRKILCIINKIFCTLLSPFVKAVKVLVNILQKVIYFIGKALAKFGVWVYNIYTSHYILRNARKGFLDKRRGNGEK